MNNNISLKAQSAGGKVMAIRQRQSAVDGYYKNPNICPTCGTIITINDGQKVAEVRKKTFCSRSCSAKYPPRKRIAQPKPICNSCGQPCSLTSETCLPCLRIKQLNGALSQTTKGALFSSKRWQNARSPIQKHARRTYWLAGKPRECLICKYKHHFEVCHIKQVSEFPDSATVGEINSIDNLVGLCPTHHWEFDHGVLKLDQQNGGLSGS